MGEKECRIFETRQAKLNLKNEYFIHELLGEIPYAFIEQVEETEAKIDAQLKALREQGYLSGTISLEEP